VTQHTDRIDPVLHRPAHVHGVSLLHRARRRVRGCRKGEIPTLRLGRRLVVPVARLLALLGDENRTFRREFILLAFRRMANRQPTPRIVNT